MTSVNCLNGLSSASQALVFASYSHQSHRVRTRLNAWHEASRCLWSRIHKRDAGHAALSRGRATEDRTAKRRTETCKLNSTPQAPALALRIHAAV